MKILSKNIMLCIAILSFLIMGCEDDLPTNNYSNNDPVTFTVYGKVINEEGNILSDARVSLSGQEVYTNQLGIYLFKDIEIDGNGSFLKVNKDGYFNSGKRIQAKDASVKKVDIQLLEGNSGGSFSSSAGGEMILNNDGLKVEFQANGFVDQNGNPYSGNVAVKYTFIPIDENLVHKAPGGLSAINTAGDEVILASFGMLGVELNDGDVNLAEGYTAKITMPVANEFLANAPSTIPLWHWNEETGFWEEDGTATLQGNTYVGDVSHFSFWNCDAPFPLIELSFQVVDENNNPVVNEYIYASINNNGVTRGGFTDDNGYVVGKFPKDETIQLSIIENPFSCSLGSYFMNESIGPFQENTDAGILTATLQNDAIIQIQGTIDNTCANENTEGYYLIVRSNTSANCSWEFYIDDSNFDVQFSGSDAVNYTATMYDAANFTSSTEYTLGTALNNIGMVSTCESSGEYVILQIENGEETNFFVEGSGEGLSHDLVNFQIAPLDSSLVLIDLASEYQSQIGFQIEYTDENDKLSTSFLNYLYFYTSSYNLNCNDNSSCSDQVLTLSEFGNSGEYLGGTISGELVEYLPDGNNLVHNYTLDFRFKID